MPLVVTGLAGAAGLEEDARQLQETFVPGDSIQPDQPQLDHLVARCEAEGAVPKIAPDELRAFQADVEQVAPPGGLEVSHPGLVHVPEVVEFVTQLRVLHPPARIDPLMGRCIRMHRPPGVKVPVGLLRGRDAGDDGVESGLQRGIAALAQHIGRALEGLEDIRVVEGKLGRRLDLERRFAARAPPHHLRREVEVAQPPRVLALLQGEWHRDGAVHLLPLVPQPARQPHRGERHRLDRIVGRRRQRRERPCRRHPCPRKHLHACPAGCRTRRRGANPERTRRTTPRRGTVPAGCARGRGRARGSCP
jgi:hypothetical protein